MLTDLSIPMIAAANGHAYAGGTQNLPRAIDVRRAKKKLMTGQPVLASRVLEWVIVNALCEPCKVLERALEMAFVTADNVSLLICQTKKSINSGGQMELRNGVAQCFPVRSRGLQLLCLNGGPLRERARI